MCVITRHQFIQYLIGPAASLGPLATLRLQLLRFLIYLDYIQLTINSSICGFSAFPQSIVELQAIVHESPAAVLILSVLNLPQYFIVGTNERRVLITNETRGAPHAEGGIPHLRRLP